MGKYSRSARRFDIGLRVGVPCFAALVLVACATRTAPPAAAPSSPSAATPASEPPGPTAPPLALPPAAMPGPVSVRADAPLTYVVQPGDTLWSIASRFLLDPWQWPEVWVVNDQIGNPHKIYPGDVLKLSFVDGRPVLSSSGVQGRSERLSPQVRELPLETSIPTIPIEAIRDFLRGPRLVTLDELGASPYLLAFADEHLVGGAGMGIYVQDLTPRQAYRYSVIRKGAVYRDPDNGEILGYEGVPVGEAEVQEYGQPSTALLSRTSREALIGDRLLPVESESFNADFYPHAPDRSIDGRIISVFDGFSQIGQYQIIALNRGSEHGLEPGHVLDVKQIGRTAADPYRRDSVALPATYAGQVLVFKATPRVSFALVMSAVRPIHLLDSVDRPTTTRG